MENINPEGLVPLIAGIYLLLASFRVIRLNAKDPEKEELWHQKFGKMTKVISPIMIVFGLIKFLGFLNI